MRSRTMSEEFSLSELDSETFKVLEQYKDVDLRITLDFIEDLGVRVEAFSAGGSFARSGDSTSITVALLRLLPKIAENIEEYKAQTARIEAMIEGDEDGEV